MYWNAALRRVRATTVAVEKVEVCVFVALGIQHAMRMRRFDIYRLPDSTEFFPHYLINGAIFGKRKLNTKCVF